MKSCSQALIDTMRQRPVKGDLGFLLTLAISALPERHQFIRLGVAQGTVAVPDGVDDDNSHQHHETGRQVARKVPFGLTTSARDRATPPAQEN
jgi:hypothetical protein